MKKCAVIIGVNKTGLLPVLTAAVQGAKEFNAWALSQDIDTVLHIDETLPVTVAEVADSVNAFLDKGIYSLMLVYFAGHGVLKSASEEQWLLSGAPRSSNEAINVQSSRFSARITGLPHIVFISDACRSIPNDFSILRVTGSVIFPNVKPRLNGRTDIDMFYATMPGDPALEVKEEQAVKNYKGIYTDCLLKGLKGEVPQVIKKLTGTTPDKWVVLSHELKNYLETAVPLAANLKSILLSQEPDGEITSREPKYLAEFDKPAEVIEVAFEKNIEKTNFKEYLNEYITLEPPLKRNPTQEIHDQNVKNLINADQKFPESPDGRGVVFNIVGGVNVRFYFEKKLLPHEVVDGNLQLIIPYIFKQDTMLLMFADGRSTPLAVLRDFDATVLIENDQVVNVNYSPSRYSVHYLNAGQYDAMISKSRAEIAAAARSGKFRLSGDNEYVFLQASYLRNYKKYDPTLGLYASYAYAQAGRFEGIASVYSYMKADPGPVLFDVAMLNLLLAKDAIMANYAPMCPLLTQGWSYLSINYKHFMPILKELASELIPGLWTTFTPRGTELIKLFLKQRNL